MVSLPGSGRRLTSVAVADREQPFPPEGPDDLSAEIRWRLTHRDGCSITGGLVYRGTRIRGLARRYVFGDFCTGALWSLRGTPGGQVTDMRRERPAIPQLTHIGADADGELLLASATGSVYRAVPAAGR